MKKRKKLKTTILLLAVAISILLIYLLGMLYFKNHFFPSTSINQTDVSLLNIDETNDMLSILPVKIKVLQKDETGKEIIIEEINLSEDCDGDLKYDAGNLMESQSFLSWPIQLFQKHELECHKVYGRYDKEKLKEAALNLYCFKNEHINPPADTHIDYVNGILTVVDASDGSMIDQEKALEKILWETETFANGSNQSFIDLRDLYLHIEPQINSSELSEKLIELNSISEKKIEIYITENNSTELKGNDLKTLLNLENSEFNVDDVNVNAYVNALSSRYDVSDREYIDRTDLKNKLRKALLALDDQTIYAEWVYENDLSQGKLIEVNYGKQTLYYYEDGELIFSSPVVTGNDNFHDSEQIPEGTYKVQRMVRNTHLRGTNYDGTTYDEEVLYWIGFGSESYYNGGGVIGFHDASWRDEFGGDIWLSNPSHGCVNMPTDMVEKLYNAVDIGTTINIYY